MAKKYKKAKKLPEIHKVEAKVEDGSFQEIPIWCIEKTVWRMEQTVKQRKYFSASQLTWFIDQRCANP